MLDKLAGIEEHYNDLEQKISDPAVIADQSKWRELAKEHSRLQNTVEAYRSYKDIQKQIAESKILLKEEKDHEMCDMIETELKELEPKMEQLIENLRLLLLPKDPNDDKNVMVEIRGGTGGDEAALFAGSLFRMYCRYAERVGYKVDVMSSSPTDIGGYKEVIFIIEGDGAYSRLKYESGVHRVQRVPETEASGRIHTSAATVAVLPEAEEVELDIDPNDLRIDLFCAGGPGGQCVNTTQSAVRITHIPTGITVSMQDEKSQHKNKDKGMRILRSRIMEKLEGDKAREEADARKSMVGTGDRSERIRTYNFPQGRVTDHRIGMTLYKLDAILDGDIDEIINGLIVSEQSEKLKSSGMDN